MALSRHRFLGLSVEDGRIVAAEVHASPQRSELLRAAEFALGEGMTLDDPQTLGRALRGFLRQHGFVSKDAVIGVSARRLLAVEKTFPGASDDALAGMVRLEAERTFVTHIDELLVDYAPGETTARGRRLLVVALAREQADALQSVCENAGLKMRALVPTSLTFAAALSSARAAAPPGATAEQPQAGMLVLLRPDYAEVVVGAAGNTRTLKHLPLPPSPSSNGTPGPAWMRALCDGMLRLSALVPQEDEVATRMRIADGVGLTPDALEEVVRSSGASGPSMVGLKDLDITTAASKDAPRAADAGRFAAAAALAAAGARAGGFPVDFLDSHLKARGQRRDVKRIALIAGAAAALVLALVLYLIDWRQGEQQLAVLTTRLAAMQPDIDATQRIVDRIVTAREWTDLRPRFLDPLADLSSAFGTSSSIWVTSLAVRQDMHIVVSGKATDERSVLDLLDRVRRTPTFDDVKLLYMRDAGGNSHEISFSMTFVFKAAGTRPEAAASAEKAGDSRK